MSIDVSSMEGVDVNWGTPVAGLRSGRNYSIGILIIKSTGRYAYRTISLPNDGKNIISPVLNFSVTPFLFPVYVCPLSAATLKERRW